MITRRGFMTGTLGVTGTGLAGGGYALAEPFRLLRTHYALPLPSWSQGPSVRLAVIADLHANDPWMSLARIRSIVDKTNELGADAILLLGDYVASHRINRLSGFIAPEDWAGALARLEAPLGVHAVLGNHDWWADVALQRRRTGFPASYFALNAVGIRVLENGAVRLEKDGKPFWLAGLGDQWAFWPRSETEKEANKLRAGSVYSGVHDVASTLAAITDDAPAILMAHEPDIFASLPERFALTVSGHTHGGQINLLGYTPVVPSAFGSRYVYGHVVEGGRHLVVSAGLGCSGLPIRFGRPPEIVSIDLYA